MNQLPMLHKEWAEQTGGQGILVVVGRNSRRGGVVASWISYFRNLSRYRHITFLENVHIKQKKKEALRSPPARITTWYSRTSNSSSDFSPVTLAVSQGMSKTLPGSSSMKW